MKKEEVFNLIEAYYKENYNKLLNKVRGRAGGHPNAEDVVQEAFTRALTYYKSYNPAVKPLDSWFGRILENTLRSHNKDRRAQGMVHDLNEHDLVTFSPSPYLLTFISEIKRDVDNLSEEKREIVDLNFFQGFTPLDISHIVEANPGAIRTTLSRFREEIREKYGKSMDG